MDGHAKNDNSI